ncbi:uncharacterized protein HD556DRAFT_1442233 [Suillus plorans]|uniref:Uncharacterized protein n=1 Tax=Suillus plorans TaxID=116603 RepID=A0A9P7AUZ4_9AGAM|nr:uncharacterized protein HD556DRAFT_1442233 [Suillus plorans]KAG1795389.1 hypothetical protein HD556DRAFT_1442233 [Suillus plorans]
MSGLDAIINRKTPSPWELFRTNPSLYIASNLYNILSQQLPRPLSSPVRTICVSGTHNTDISALIPPGDILIHAGDITHSGTPREHGIIYLEDEAHTIQVRGRVNSLICASWILAPPRPLGFLDEVL